MRRPSSLLIAIQLLVLLLAFWLRIHALDAQPLRGDEAFTVRYWAAPPADVLSHLAWVEPHPFGAFFGFWAWKSLAGQTEFAMRLLPALLNLVGAAAIYALARRLARRTPGTPARVIGLVAAFLWAINPDLIWHSQDVRNYAPWAGLSALALWLLMRAADKNRRIDWWLYVVVETIALYTFFLEAFMLIVHLLYVILIARRRLRGQVLASFAVIGLLLIPWLYQAFRLAGSGYGGTGEGSDLVVMATVFIPTLLFGEDLSRLAAALPGAFVTGWLLIYATLWGLLTRRRAASNVLLLLIVPSILLYLAGTRLDVFRPRYILAITPGLALALAWSLAPWRLSKYAGPLRILAPAARLAGALLLIVTVILSADALLEYFGGDYRKAPDWRALAAYLEANVGPDDALIVTAADTNGSFDPTFQYYYDGAFVVLPRADADIPAEIAALAREHATLYLIDQPSWDQTVRHALDSEATHAEDVQADVFRIGIYHAGP
ncbi:MAG: glycosyltransferase family 39 protein [Anaerolineae bacterium]|nr:glycosyltransferase family 39 protein [Anaerolineae bacterium]